MKTTTTMMTGILAALVLVLGGVNRASADVLLDDHFGDGSLGTNTDGPAGTGFNFTSNPNGPNGSASEGSSKALIIDGSGNPAYSMDGITSKDSFDLSNGSGSYTVTWTVSRYVAQNWAGFFIQTSAGFYSTPASYACLYIDFNSGAGNRITIRYQSDSVANTQLAAATSPTMTDSDTDGFTVTCQWDGTGFEVTVVGYGSNGTLTFSDTWANDGFSYSDIFGNGNMYVAAHVTESAAPFGGGGTGYLDVDRIQLDSVAAATPGTLIYGKLGGTCHKGGCCARKRPGDAGPVGIGPGALCGGQGILRPLDAGCEGRDTGCFETA